MIKNHEIKFLGFSLNGQCTLTAVSARLASERQIKFAAPIMQTPFSSAKSPSRSNVCYQ